MRQISKYQVEDMPLGIGGMGQVLKGYAPDGTPVAIKEIKPEFVLDPEFRARIEDEVRVLRRLNHESVVRIYDNFELDNRLYIVMELIEGMNIEQYVGHNGAMTVSLAVDLFTKILQAMQYVHEEHIVHRDIKPGNIMIRSNGNVCLLDFGIAKDTNAAMTARTRTIIGTIIGTDGYMSPEQANGMSIDHRSDIYSLGCVFFYMLTGHHAFPKLASEVETQLSIVNNDFPKLSKYVKGIPSGIQNVLDHATDKNMMKRYQSCREFLSELMKVSGLGTQINTGNRTDEVSVSIGRENCDICVATDNYRVSRHHADIKLKEFTGGVFYVYTDCSSNGTKINDEFYTKGMSCNIPADKTPVIYLAGDAACQLNWEEVRQVIAIKLKERSKASSDDGKTVTLSDEEIRGLLGGADDGGVTVWQKLLGVLFSFLSPLLGGVLWMIFKDSKPDLASLCGKVAVVSFVINMIVIIIMGSL
jgi:serine/threonine-protein kinase